MDADVLVVGAGPAGLGVGACLRRQGVETLVVDRGAGVGDSPRRRYERLHLHTPRIQSALPGRRIPRRFGRWVAEDDLAEYLRGYAEHAGVVPRFGTEGRRLDRTGDSWTRVTADGGTIRRRQVVVASGYDCTPVAPAWPGQEGSVARCCTPRAAPPPRPTGGETCSWSARATPVPRSRPTRSPRGRSWRVRSPTKSRRMTGLELVVGHLGVLDGRGHPLVTGRRPAAPGLRFVVLSNPLEGLLVQIDLDARAAARAVAKDLRPDR